MTATSAGATSSALVVGGLNASSMGDLAMAQLLGGKLKGQDRVSVWWPAEATPITGGMSFADSVEVGATNLSAAIETALGKLANDANGHVVGGQKVTVVGLSAGSLVVNEVMHRMVDEGFLPDPSEITFVVVEDSLRAQGFSDSKYSKKFDYTYVPPPVTPYDVIVVTGEYDGNCDMPDRRWNLLAVANAMIGSKLVHVPVMFADYSKVPAKNITVEVNAAGGTTTHYLVPTKTLPLVVAFPILKPREAELKAKIDKGYSRNDPVATTANAGVASDGSAAPDTQTQGSADADGAAASTPEAQPAPVSAAAAKREARAEARAEAKVQRAEAKAQRAEARAEAKAQRAEARAERAEARAAAKADAAAKREARKAARAQASSGASSSDGVGSSDSSGSSE